jgi:diaminopimelate decarboxylase
MPSGFRERLLPLLPDIAARFGTPFHVYDEAGIRGTGEALKRAFADVPGFREYYAVKALPNPAILGIMREMGFGFDCSSVAELVLSRQLGARGADIMFTSNNTARAEFEAALSDGGCILNLDDISLVDKAPRLPDLVCFRYNPGSVRSGNSIIGAPEEAKYGVTPAQLLPAFQKARERGAKRFGLHTMLASNELNADYMIQTVAMLLEVIERVGRELSAPFEFINIGGGLGIPYRPEQPVFDVKKLGAEAAVLLRQFKQRNGWQPKVYMESGRYMTGPHGVLVTTAINHKDIYRTYVGVDASMSALMRPGMYGAYHHVEVLGKTLDEQDPLVDVVGSLCENNDKFAVQRQLPKVTDGDLLVIHDSGAHGHAMGFNYNGRLRPKELLLKQNGDVALIRREETLADYFATLTFEPQVFRPDAAATARAS